VTFLPTLVLTLHTLQQTAVTKSGAPSIGKAVSTLKWIHANAVAHGKSISASDKDLKSSSFEVSVVEEISEQAKEYMCAFKLAVRMRTDKTSDWRARRSELNDVKHSLARNLIEPTAEEQRLSEVVGAKLQGVDDAQVIFQGLEEDLRTASETMKQSEDEADSLRQKLRSAKDSASKHNSESPGEPVSPPPPGRGSPLPLSERYCGAFPRCIVCTGFTSQAQNKALEDRDAAMTGISSRMTHISALDIETSDERLKCAEFDAEFDRQRDEFETENTNGEIQKKDLFYQIDAHKKILDDLTNQKISLGLKTKLQGESLKCVQQRERVHR